MNCDTGNYGQGEQEIYDASRINRWRMRCIAFITAAAMFAWVFNISRSWMGNQQDAPKKNWVHLQGNDGKFWKGTPDDSIYGSMEGVRGTAYYEYLYDSAGRLSKINTFRRHDYNDSIWVLSDEETYEYDSEGRISTRSAVSGDVQWIYEYTEKGHTETHSWNYMANDLIYSYDLAGNLIFFRNAGNYRYPHATTFEYDEKNRLVRKILEVEGKEPYGIPPHVILTIEYDDENYSSVETEYNAGGEVTCIWLNTYDEEWNKTAAAWYVPENIPKGYTVEECADYYTKGYWVSYCDGVMMEEMSNEPWKNSSNNSSYTAYDYDGNGNCIMELKVYSVSSINMYRYVYDARGRLKEQYAYDFSGVEFWERQLSDGSKLTLENGGEEFFGITRTALDGTIGNRFVYGDGEVDMQYTPTETICWQISPAQVLAEREPEPEEPNGPMPEEPVSLPPAIPEIYLYTVKRGDCLWRIAEEFLGDGQKYEKIYLRNKEVIGDDPGLILPGMDLYIEIE